MSQPVLVLQPVEQGQVDHMVQAERWQLATVLACWCSKESLSWYTGKESNEVQCSTKDKAYPYANVISQNRH